MNPDEMLLRWIKNVPNLWKHSQNRPTSAIFKQSNGVSVDRVLERELQFAIEELIQNKDPGKRYTKAVVSITVNDCFNCETFPFEDPMPDNPFHAQIYDSPDTIIIQNPKRRCLIRSCNSELIMGAITQQDSST